LERGIQPRLSASEGRKFAFPVGLAFLVLGGIVLWRGHSLVATAFGSISILLLVAGALVPTLLGPVLRGWMAFAHLLSRVTTPIFMGLTFFLVMAPIGLAMRLAGKNPMIRSDRDGSFWVPRAEGKPRRSDLTRQF
jgi:hypothetical protein